MRSRTWIRWTAAVALASASVVPVVLAQQEVPKTLPSLLIKGEVVSVDTSDPAAALLKVKDRYGFETPIYLSKETKIAQGDQTLTVANLTAGKAVEVEYNFDINTAKRHAVNVAVSAGPAATAATPAAPAVSVSTPASTTAPIPAASPAASSAAPAPTASAAAATSSSASAPDKAAATPEQPSRTKTP